MSVRRAVRCAGALLFAVSALTSCEPIVVRGTPAPTTWAGFEPSGGAPATDEFGNGRRAETVGGWSNPAGTAGYFLQATGAGDYVMALSTLTHNQAHETSSGMWLRFLNGSGSAQMLRIPTNLGHSAVPAGATRRGTDVADVQPLSGTRVAFASAYPAYDASTGEAMPSIGQAYKDASGVWRYDTAGSATAAELMAGSSQGADACDPSTCGVPAEMATVGTSGGSTYVAVTQYVGDEVPGNPPRRRGGQLMVVRLTPGVKPTVVAELDLDAEGLNGVQVAPRAIEADPTTPGRFVVVYDGYPFDFRAQTFQFDKVAGTITARSKPFTLDWDGSASAAPETIETAAFDEYGNLWVAGNTNAATPAGNYHLGVIAPNELTGSAACAQPAGAAPLAHWGSTCRPVRASIVVNGSTGQKARQLIWHAGLNAMVLLTWIGYVKAIPFPNGNPVSTTPTPTVRAEMGQYPLYGYATTQTSRPNITVDARNGALDGDAFIFSANTVACDWTSFPPPKCAGAPAIDSVTLPSWAVSVDLAQLLA